MSSNLQDFWETLENPLVSGIVSTIALIIIGSIRPDLWSLVFTALIAFFTADIVANIFIRGGHGIVQSPVFGTHTLHKGHGFVFFVIAIIVGTYFSGSISDYIETILLGSGNVENNIMFSSVGLIIISYLDYVARYYSSD